jgi:hypothetical protein
MSSSQDNSIAGTTSSSSQPTRFPAALDSASAPLEGRTQAELAALARAFAKGLAFWRLSGQLDPNESWSKFLPDLSSLVPAEAQAASCPQKALFLAFLHMYEDAKIELNRVTARHLEFYYREVLGLAPRGPVPDQAHILVSLKKTAAELLIPTGTRFKTKDGLEYTSELEVVANRAELVHRRILAVDADTGRLRYAVEAASSDGLGEPLPEQDPAWHPFGYGHTLPNSSLGFAVSSPVLLMQEGERKVTLTLMLAGVAGSLAPETISASLGGYLSGEKEWLDAGSPIEASVARNDQGLLELRLTFALDSNAGPVVAYDPTVLDGGFDTLAPVLKILLLENATNEVAAALTASEVDSIRIDVEVTGMKALILENDFGRLDPAKVFMPFGPSPKVGNSFYINAEEAFLKDVTGVKLHLLWSNPPEDFAKYYQGYTDRHGQSVNNAYFSADLEILRDGKFQQLTSASLFETYPPKIRTIDSEESKTPQISKGGVSYAEFAGQFSRDVPVAKVQMPFSDVKVAQPLKAIAVSPVRAFRERLRLPSKFTPSNLRAFKAEGFLRLRLKKDFLHDRYPELYADAIVFNQTNPPVPKPVPFPPYTPELASFTLDYEARSPIFRPNSADAGVFDARDMRLFHLTPFGQREEHRYIREQVSAEFLSVTLFPAIKSSGELYLGLTGIAARESISLLFQFLEGSANPLSVRQPITWSVLASNHWKSLPAEQILAERTNNFLVSGVVRLLLPPETTTNNTWLEPGFVWLRAAIVGDLTAVCRLLAIHPNAVPVLLANPGLATHLDASLPAGSITQAPAALSGVKEVAQPYGSSRGLPAESARSFHTRTSERLRHRKRAVTPWDFERLILDQFPGVYRARCLPHTDRNVRPAPGYVTLVLVPDTRGRNQANPLMPFTDLATLSSAESFLSGFQTPFAQVAAINPLFEPLKVGFKVAFQPGKPYSTFRSILDEDLKRLLSPWAFDARLSPEFGGAVLRSELLRFIESLDYVDYLTELKLLPSTPHGDPASIQRVSPSTPASIVTSAPSHQIEPI